MSMSVLLLALLVVFGLNTNVSLSFDNGNLIRKIFSIDSDQCDFFCAEEPKCSSWTFIGIGNYPEKFNNTQANPSNKCYLERTDVSIIKSKLNYGVTTQYNDDDKLIVSGLKKSFDVERLLVGPMVFDSTILMNFEQNLYRGCSYTISMWVWIWKLKNPPNNRILALFSTRQIDPLMNKFEPIFPSIVYNLESNPERLFFSVTKDERGDFEGFWLNEDITYNKWFHITLVSTKDYISSYIDGELIERASHRISNKKPNPPINDDNHQKSNQLLSSSICPYNHTNIHSNLINNTIFQLGGGKNIHSMTGMIQDVLIFKNIVLTPSQITTLMRERPPLNTSSLNYLLDIYNIPHISSICPRKWKNNFYLFIEWKLCPESVCGRVCLDERFLLGQFSTHLPKYYTRTDEYDANTPGQAEDFFDDGDIEGGSDPSPQPSQSTRNRHNVRFDGGDDGVAYDYQYAPDNDAQYDDNGDAYAYAYGYQDGAGAGGLTFEELRRHWARGGAGRQQDGVPRGAAGGGRRLQALGNDVYGYYDEAVGDEVASVGSQASDGQHQQQQQPQRRKEVVDKSQKLSHKPLVDQSKNAVKDGSREREGERDRESPSSLPKRQRSRSLKKDPTSRMKSSDSDTTSTKTTFEDFKSWISTSIFNFIDSFDDRTKTGNNQMEPQDGDTAGYSGRDSSQTKRNMEYIQNMSRNEYIAYQIREYELDMVQSLYDSSISWLNGRYFGIQADLNMSYDDWRTMVYDSSFAALSLSLWMSEDLSTPEDMDIPWFVRYSSVLSQPMRMILGFRQGYDQPNHIKIPDDLGVYLQDTLTVSLGTILRGNSSSSPSHHTVPGLVQTGLSRPVEGAVSMSGELRVEDVSVGSTDVRIHPVEMLLDLIIEVQDGDRSGLINVEMGVSGDHSVEAPITHNMKDKIRDYIDRLETVPGKVAESSFLDEYLFSSAISSIPKIMTENECATAAAHYFPVAQYVTSHTGLVETGVRPLETVHITNPKSLTGHTGEDDELQLVHEAEALAGNGDAQMWVGRRYFWGFGGLPPDMMRARRWFEMAADQGHAEGLYNIGVFYTHGQAGFPKNQTKAIDYFRRAAHQVHPFHMALHAMGNYYMGNFEDKSAQNLTRARHYFEMAAAMDSPEGHFSLALMLKDGVGGERDVRRAVYHFSVAASFGQIRSISHLAHGLYDPESWLGKYSRDVIFKDITNSTLKPSFDISYDREYFQDIYGNQSNKNTSNDNHFRNKKPKKKKKLANQRKWYENLYRYNESEPIRVFLPYAVVELPEPLTPSCKSALPLLQYVASNIYRANDLTSAALNAYVRDSLWEALDYYDEAADLGIAFAQDNAAFLYEELEKYECAPDGPRLNWLFESFENFTGSDDMYTNLSSKALSVDQCVQYMKRMGGHRWSQLAKYGLVVAIREIADLKAKGVSPFDKNITNAVELYTLGAEAGDIQSLMKLGWVFFRGGDVVHKNLTLASRVFATAFNWEVGENTTVPAAESTRGIAPGIAWMLVRLEILFPSLGIQDLVFNFLPDYHQKTRHSSFGLFSLSSLSSDSKNHTNSWILSTLTTTHDSNHSLIVDIFALLLLCITFIILLLARRRRVRR